MQRRHYELVAKVLSACVDSCQSDEQTTVVKAIITKFANTFEDEYPNFNRGRFVAASGYYADVVKRLTEEAYPKA